MTGKVTVCSSRTSTLRRGQYQCPIQGHPGDRRQSDELSGFPRIMGAFLAVLQTRSVTAYYAEVLGSTDYHAEEI
jgi:hypothetical protein